LEQQGSMLKGRQSSPVFDGPIEVFDGPIEGALDGDAVHLASSLAVEFRG
jgi:hypothetical protein